MLTLCSLTCYILCCAQYSILAADMGDHGQDQGAYLNPDHLRYDGHRFDFFGFSPLSIHKVI